MLFPGGPFCPLESRDLSELSPVSYDNSISSRVDVYNFRASLALCLCLVAQSCLTLCDAMEPARLLCPRDSPGKNTGEGCHLLFQGISPPRD